MIYSIDPGPERSGTVTLDAWGVVIGWGESENAALLPGFFELSNQECVVIEDFTPYGQRLGHESIATIKWIGAFRLAAAQAGCVVKEIPRPDVKLHLCGIRTAKDADVRDALIHRYGPGREKAIGRRATPGPLFGISGHCWSALAVGVVAFDRMNGMEAMDVKPPLPARRTRKVTSKGIEQ